MTPVLPLITIPLAALLCSWLWSRAGHRRTGRAWAAILIVLCLADGLLLGALSPLRIAFGPVVHWWMGLAMARTLLIYIAGVASWRANKRDRRGISILAKEANLFLLILVAYSIYVEPLHLTLSRQQIEIPAEKHAPNIRIVQLSDLHVERVTARERGVLSMVQRLAPDMVVLTGDYVNLDLVNDERARRDTRQVLSQLHGPLGVYAVSGSSPVDTQGALQAEFDGLENVRLLRDEVISVTVQNRTLYIVGVSNGKPEVDKASLNRLMGQVPPGAPTLLLYHTPDLVETAAQAGVDIYLAGHTHGGQIRLPIYGALITSSRYGKRYEMGSYQVGPTHLYVSRGIGMEGFGLPRARVLAPPEVVEIRLADSN